MVPMSATAAAPAPDVTGRGAAAQATGLGLPKTSPSWQSWSCLLPNVVSSLSGRGESGEPRLGEEHPEE